MFYWTKHRRLPREVYVWCCGWCPLTGRKRRVPQVSLRSHWNTFPGHITHRSYLSRYWCFPGRWCNREGRRDMLLHCHFRRSPLRLCHETSQTDAYCCWTTSLGLRGCNYPSCFGTNILFWEGGRQYQIISYDLLVNIIILLSTCRLTRWSSSRENYMPLCKDTA